MTSKRKITIKWLALIIASLVLIAPYAYTVCLSVPSADDFSMAYTARLMDNSGSLISTAYRVANYYYDIWGGTWVSFFLEILINPLLIFYLPLKCYGAEMLVMFFVFLLSVFSFFNRLLKNGFGIEPLINRTAISLAVLAMLLMANVYMEIFYWFVGSCYSWAVSFTLVSAGNMIRLAEKVQNKRNIFLPPSSECSPAILCAWIFRWVCSRWAY